MVILIKLRKKHLRHICGVEADGQQSLALFTVLAIVSIQVFHFRTLKILMFSLEVAKFSISAVEIDITLIKNGGYL